MFQSTHPRGVRPGAGHARRGAVEVSIHAPAWGATHKYLPCAPGIGGFNPRTRVGCDGNSILAAAPSNMFQSTHPRGVRRRGAPGAGVHLGFNPRTRVGCDTIKFVTEALEGRFQSTHPRGVRQYPTLDAAIAAAVSIHAPAWGATWIYPPSLYSPSVSIHAPAWGATCRAVARWMCRAGFNPRTRVGCDQAWQHHDRGLTRFQSTHPRGVRPRQMIR